MSINGHDDRLGEGLDTGLERIQIPDSQPRLRAVIVEPHSSVRAVLEYLLMKEGFSVEVWREVPPATVQPGPALVLLAAEKLGGLCIFEVQDVSDALIDLSQDAVLLQESLGRAEGIWSYIPKPFGVGDVLRVVRAVSSFDARKKSPVQAFSSGS